jgi:hypothetical protein
VSLQGVADSCAAALAQGAPPPQLAWSHGECCGWVHVLTWGKGLGWRDATWQRRWLVLRRDQLFELEAPEAAAALRRVGVGKGRRVLAVEDEHGALLCGEEHVLAVAAAGLPRAHAVLAPDSFVWRCDDERACSQWAQVPRQQHNARAPPEAVPGSIPLNANPVSILKCPYSNRPLSKALHRLNRLMAGFV